MFTHRSDRIADAVRLLATFGAVAADPSLLGALTSGPFAYDALKKIAAAPPSSIGRLADMLTVEARAVFAATHDLPPDADLLYGQMVEAGLVTPAEIVAGAMEAGAVTEAMLARLDDPEHRTPAMQALFRRLTVPVLTRLFADKDFAADLTPAFMQGVLGQLAGLSEKLDRLDRLTRLEMEALANRFEIERIFALSDAGLRAALEKKAEDYRAYRALIEAIDERTAGLGELKAAARDAAERLDFDQVEALLSHAHAVELEIAAETAVLRADNALLRGRVEDAFTVLSAAADSFAAISPTEPTEKRVLYGARFEAHGSRYGGAGLDLAERMIRRALDDLSDGDDPGLWAGLQNELGSVLTERGRRVGGADGAALLDAAVEAFRAALRVYSEADHPVDWATVHNNLGIALVEQGSLAGRAAGAALQAEAVSAYGAALRVWTEADHPVSWARTQNNLGIALAERGGGTGGAAGAALLAAAVDAHGAALRVYTEEAHPEEWATVQHNLGVARATQGDRAGGAAQAALLADAAAAYGAALRVRTEAAQPVVWATTMENLGLARVQLAENPACPDPKAELIEAAECFEAALRVFDPEHMRHNFEKATEALARVRARLAGHRGGREG